MAEMGLVGIPGSFVDEGTKRLRWHRMSDTQRSYQADLPGGGYLTAIVTRDAVSDGKPLWHISVSLWAGPGKPGSRYPTWDELKHAYYTLIPDDVPMVLVFPRRSTPKHCYVDIAPTCLHLWESTDATVDL